MYVLYICKAMQMHLPSIFFGALSSAAPVFPFSIFEMQSYLLLLARPEGYSMIDKSWESRPRLNASSKIHIFRKLMPYWHPLPRSP